MQLLQNYTNIQRNNPEFIRLAKIDKQIGDSLTNISHVVYEVVLPENYLIDKEYPILFVFHGNMSNFVVSKKVKKYDTIFT